MSSIVPQHGKRVRARNPWRWGAFKIRELRSRPGIVFAREWARSPRKAGAVWPSGSALARAMAERVPEGSGLVVELGAGTAIPSVRHFSQRILHHHGGRLIRINPREWEVPTRSDVGLPMGAAQGLALVEQALSGAL